MSDESGVTRVTVQGTGGAVWEQDVPAEGSDHRSIFDKQVAKGDLVILDGEIAEGAATGEKSGEAAPAAPGDEPEPYPAGKSIDAVLAWVGADHERAAEALTAEQAKAKPRPKLVEHLTSLPFEVPHQPAGAGSIVSEA